MNFSFGVCTGLSNAAVAKEAGADFLEPSFGGVAGMEPERFRESAALARSAGIPVLAMNGMIPPDVPLYTPDFASCLALVERGMERAASLGVKCTVFGSGTARSVPSDMSEKEASVRLCEILFRIREIAAPYGITLLLEPLRCEETNFIHTLEDAATLLDCLAVDDVGINADVYHMLFSGEPFAEMKKHALLIKHLHICSPTRKYPLPGQKETDEILRSFLREAGYVCSEVSIEGKAPRGFEVELPTALAYLHELAASI